MSTTMPTGVIDVMVEQDGLFMFTLMTAEARPWVDEMCDVPSYLWLTNATFAMDDRRLAEDIAEGMTDHGLVLW